MSMQTASTSRPLARVQAVVEQRPQTVLAAVLLQADYLAADEVGEHSPEVLALSALDFVDAKMPGSAFWTRAIPRLEERAFGPARRAPAHRMPHGRVTGRHRLTIEPNALAEASGQARVRIGKAHPLGANPASPTPQPAQPVP
jgi:hypothetical protein